MKNNLLGRIPTITWVMFIAGLLILMESNSCQTISPEDAVNTYIGKWKLAWTNVNMDSVFINKVFLTLNRDSTFSCNSSFFIRRDSLMAAPCSGQWKITIINHQSFTDASKPNKLYVTSEKLSRTWDISGLASAGYMDWASGIITYSWTLVK